MHALLLTESNRVSRRLLPLLHAWSDLAAIDVAHSVPAALRHLRQHDCDVVLLELSLRTGRAWQVLAALERPTPRRATQPPCIVLTNSANEVVRRHCQALGAAAVFDKSIQIDELCAYLRGQHHRTH